MTIDNRLEELAPSHAQSAERVTRIRDEVLAHAVASHRPAPERPAWRTRSRRPWLLAGAAAAACATALVVGPTLAPAPEPFAANALTPLARAAEQTEVPPLSGGRVLHRVTQYRQTQGTSERVTVMKWEEWTLNDGTYYRQTTVDGEAGPIEYWDAAPSEFSPSEIAALPTDPAKLLEAVEGSEQVTSSLQGDRSAAEEALGRIIYGGYAPTKVWAAAIEAYGSFDDVQVRVDEEKKLTFVTEVAKGGPLTMLFDSRTGQLRGYDATSPQDGGATESMRVSLSQVEDGLPARVADDALPAGR